VKDSDFLCTLVDEFSLVAGSAPHRAAFSAIHTFGHSISVTLRGTRNGTYEAFHVSTALIITTSFIDLNYFKNLVALIASVGKVRP
jgi:hypothetical protein